MITAAVILAAGSGSRMGTGIKKQYMDLGGHPVLFYSVNAFQKSSVDRIVIVTSKEDVVQVASQYMTDEFDKVAAVVEGGRERYDSVYAGLCAVGECGSVLIHDGARPFVNGSIISRCLEDVEKYGACVAAVRSKDTVKIADAEGFVSETPDRSRVWIAQTPQCFSYELIFEAYSALIQKEKNDGLEGMHVTDDAMVAEYFMGTKVKLTEGSYNNIKITTPSDIPLAESILASEN